MEEKALTFVILAGGIVAGFMAWSFIAPMLSSVSATPSA